MMSRSEMYLALAALTACCASSDAEDAKPTREADQALRAYVAAEDASFGWRIRRTGKLGSGTYAELTLTSQTWRGIPWKHQLFIYRPEKLSGARQAILVIAGGKWKASLAGTPAADEQLPKEALVMAALADGLGSPVAVVLQVPHQPLFSDMVEDEIISHTFQAYLESGDVGWPLLLPMTKAAVRAMDAVQEFARDEWEVDIERFLVAGASKRGWTTWLAGAMDPRVNAIAPIVINMLNMEAHMDLQKTSFGGFSGELHDYTDKGLPKHLGTERGRLLQTIVDPYSYREQLNLPKLIILGTNDRYWPVDALNLYWNELSGEKHILFVPNNGHGISDYARVLGGVEALHARVSDGTPLPNLKWSFEPEDDNPELRLSIDTRPAAVRIWSATAPSRDFREARWSSIKVKPSEQDEMTYSKVVSRPATGFSAVFAEAEFPGKSVPFFLSTQLWVVASEGRETGN